MTKPRNIAVQASIYDSVRKGRIAGSGCIEDDLQGLKDLILNKFRLLAGGAYCMSPSDKLDAR
jgi:hypothetical protein